MAWPVAARLGRGCEGSEALGQWLEVDVGDVQAMGVQERDDDDDDGGRGGGGHERWERRKVMWLARHTERGARWGEGRKKRGSCD